MRRPLDYATQLSELEKIAKLAGTTTVERALPELLPPRAATSCLVCTKKPARACSACASVSYCGVAHQRADARFHDPVCDALRDLAEDQRPLEGPPLVTELLDLAGRHANMRKLRGWDDLLGTTHTPTRRRRLSDLATRPLTLASMLAAMDFPSRARRPGVVNVHVMAATERELDVPLEVWAIASKLRGTRLDLTLVGPELPTRKPSKATHPEVTIRTRKSLYGRALWTELQEPDLIVGYDCGLVMYPSWKTTILELRGAGAPFVITTFRRWEADAEAKLLSAAKALCVMPATTNPWASLSGKRSVSIANDLTYDNTIVSVWA